MPFGYRDLLGLTGSFFGTISGGPVLANAAAAQRDADRTFLVDVGFLCFDPAGAGQPMSILVEWSLGTALVPGAWSPATANPYDRLHTAGNPPALAGVPIVGPGRAYNFVWNAFQDLPDGLFPFVWVRVTVADVALLEAQTVVGPLLVVTSRAGTADPLVAQLARRAAVARAPLDLLGNGLDLPFRRGASDFASVSGVDLVRARVRQILGTRAAFGDERGELPWRPDFGQKLWVLKHRNNDRALRARASAFVRDALRWERSVRVVSVETERPPLPNPEILLVHVKYQVLSDDQLGNGVVVPVFTDTARVAA